MKIKKGQKDSKEEESIYEKEGKEGNNDMCGKFTITRKTKQKKKIQLKNTDENVVWSKIKKKNIKLVMSFCCFVSRSFTQLYYVK